MGSGIYCHLMVNYTMNNVKLFDNNSKMNGGAIVIEESEKIII